MNLQSAIQGAQPQPEWKPDQQHAAEQRGQRQPYCRLCQAPQAGGQLIDVEPQAQHPIIEPAYLDDLIDIGQMVRDRFLQPGW